ncbi:MAG TPA: flagellar assembly peptidoglycan hydrolase FlgJ [Xanthobacteraceae bacterium]
MAVLHALASPIPAASVAAPLLRSGASGAPALGKPAADLKTKARAAAVNFEAQFLNSMFSQMFAGIKGDGPFGGGAAVGVWRSFLSEQYAKSFAKAGGIGIADQVYHALLAQQEAHAR